MFYITAGNVSNLAEISDYEVEAGIAGRNGRKPIWNGKVKGHRRADGWIVLLEQILKQAKEDACKTSN